MRRKSTLIEKLEQRLAQAERDILAAERPDSCGYHDNLKQIRRRDQIARKLEAALERSHQPPPWFNPWPTIAAVAVLGLLAWFAGRLTH